MTMSILPGRGGVNSEVGPIGKVKDLAGSTGPETLGRGPIPTSVSPREALRGGGKDSVVT